MKKTVKRASGVVVRYPLDTAAKAPDGFSTGATVRFKKTTGTVVARCYVAGEWKYDLRLSNGSTASYVPHGLVSA